MKQELSILIRPDADFSEVKDSIKDVLSAGIIIETALGDGWQWSDLLEATKVESRVREVINDAPTFWKQFLQLNGNTAIKAVTEAANELVQEGYTFGPVTRWLINLLYAGASIFQFAEDSFFRGRDQYEMIQALFAGDDIIPAPEA